MAAAKDLGPLDWRTPIVDGSGRPSPEFQRRWNTQRGNNDLIGSVTLGSGAPTGSPSDGAEYVDTSTTPYTVYLGKADAWHKAGAVVFTDLSDAPHAYAGAGLALVRVKSAASGVEFATLSSVLDSALGTPAAGQLLQRGAAAWGLVTLSSVLDGISPTRGSVLYRGAAGWAALGPGTAGQVLQTGGGAADPSWVAQSGGGATTMEIGVPHATFPTGDGITTGNYVGSFVLAPINQTINSVKFSLASAAATSTFTPAIYSLNANGSPNALLASGPTVTGGAVGINKLPLSASFSMVRGTRYAVGFILQVASISGSTATGGGVFWTQAGTTPPATAPGTISYVTAAWFAVWASPDT